jgi:PilZ domain
MQESRQEPRKRALKSGKIVFNNRFSAIDCTVRNLSAKGAMLLIAGPIGIPDAFTLELESGALKRDCRVVWRDERRLGVVFG